MSKTRKEARSVVELSEDEARKRESLDERTSSFLAEIETAYINSGGNRLFMTSGRRDPSQKVGVGYKTSLHNTGEAFDIRPDNDFYKWALNTEEGMRIMSKHQFRILDETNPIIKNKTGATGDHFHIDNDPRYQEWIKDRYERISRGDAIEEMATYSDFASKGIGSGGRFFTVGGVEYFVSNNKDIMSYTSPEGGFNTTTDSNVIVDVLKGVGRDFEPRVLSAEREEEVVEKETLDIITDFANRLSGEEELASKDYVKKLAERDEEIKRIRDRELLRVQKEAEDRERLETVLGVYDNLYSEADLSIVEDVDVAPMQRSLPSYTPTAIRFENPFIGR